MMLSKTNLKRKGFKLSIDDSLFAGPLGSVFEFLAPASWSLVRCSGPIHLHVLVFNMPMGLFNNDVLCENPLPGLNDFMCIRGVGLGEQWSAYVFLHRIIVNSASTPPTVLETCCVFQATKPMPFIGSDFFEYSTQKVLGNAQRCKSIEFGSNIWFLATSTSGAGKALLPSALLALISYVNKSNDNYPNQR